MVPHDCFDNIVGTEVRHPTFGGASQEAPESREHGDSIPTLTEAVCDEHLRFFKGLLVAWLLSAPLWLGIWLLVRWLL